MIRYLCVPNDGIKDVRKALSGKGDIQGVNDYPVDKMPNACQQKYGNMVVAFEPTAEFVAACHPVPVLAVCASKEIEAPEGAIRVINGPTVAANTANAIRKIRDIIIERHLTTFSVIPLDDDDDDDIVIVPVVKKVEKVDSTIKMVDPMTGSIIEPGTKTLTERIEDAKNNPIPAKEEAPKLSRGLGGKIQIGEHPIPIGTKMVSINYKGVRCNAEIVAVDGSAKLRFNGNNYDSLTECSDQATIDAHNFMQKDLGQSHKGEPNKARTTGTRFWFPEDIPANKVLRSLCSNRGYDISLTDGVRWNVASMVIDPAGPPKRGRKKKPVVAVIPTVPVPVTVIQEEEEVEVLE